MKQCNLQFRRFSVSNGWYFTCIFDIVIRRCNQYGQIEIQSVWWFTGRVDGDERNFKCHFRWSCSIDQISFDRWNWIVPFFLFRRINLKQLLFIGRMKSNGIFSLFLSSAYDINQPNRNKNWFDSISKAKHWNSCSLDILDWRSLWADQLIKSLLCRIAHSPAANEWKSKFRIWKIDRFYQWHGHAQDAPVNPINLVIFPSLNYSILDGSSQQTTLSLTNWSVFFFFFFFRS